MHSDFTLRQILLSDNNLNVIMHMYTRLMEEKVQTTTKTAGLMGFKITPIHILIVVILLAVLVVSYLAISNSSVPVVQIGDMIKVNYTGTLTNGTVFDSSVGRGPLNFTVGSGQVIEGFDQGVVGMKLHEEKTITIPANQAYGPVNPALIIQVPKSSFGNQTVQVGMGVSKIVNGQQVRGIITTVNATSITVDFNPPLAGQTLIFKITVVAIQKKA